CDAVHWHGENGPGCPSDALRSGTLFEVTSRNARVVSRVSRGDHKHSGNRRTLPPRAGIRTLKIPGISGAGWKDAARIFARTVLSRAERTLWRTGDARAGV